MLWDGSMAGLKHVREMIDGAENYYSYVDSNVPKRKPPSSDCRADTDRPRPSPRPLLDHFVDLYTGAYAFVPVYHSVAVPLQILDSWGICLHRPL
jgi:hypothetical protein